MKKNKDVLGRINTGFGKMAKSIKKVAKDYEKNAKKKEYAELRQLRMRKKKAKLKADIMEYESKYMKKSKKSNNPFDGFDII